MSRCTVQRGLPHRRRKVYQHRICRAKAYSDLCEAKLCFPFQGRRPLALVKLRPDFGLGNQGFDERAVGVWVGAGIMEGVRAHGADPSQSHIAPQDGPKDCQRLPPTTEFNLWRHIMGGQTRLLLVAGQVLVNICACTTVEGSLIVNNNNNSTDHLM